jgi:environmental stress-induced protein Ves
MSARILRAAEHVRMPWKNGLGMTTEIARADSLCGDGFDWRISLADVAADGPFSLFPGLHRHIAVIAGDGMILQFSDGVSHRLEPFVPFSFDGMRPLHGTLLNGPVRDLNVMVRAAQLHAVLEILPAHEPVALSPLTNGSQGFAIVLSGSFVDRSGQVLLPDDTVWLSEAAPCRLTPNLNDTGSTLAIVTIRPHRP